MRDTRKTTAQGSPDELVSLEEAAEYLSVSKPTLYRMLDREEVKAVKVGRQWRFRHSDLDAYLTRGPVAVEMSGLQPEQVDAESAAFATLLEQPAPEAAGSGEERVAALTSQIIALALHRRASDIHLEPLAHEGLLRLRVDGILHEVRRLPPAVYRGVLLRVKAMAALSLEERRVPQDGRITLRHQGHPYDLRVSVIPTIHGESAVLRILDAGMTQPRLGEILPAEYADVLRGWLRRPHGLVVTTGPTGSGKTTVLYACLMEVARTEVKTLTIEDPVEYILPHATQVAVNPQAGLTFASALRAFMRQDPDVVMVGELRDAETTKISFWAAMTGHLVLTQLHADDTLDALDRLEQIAGIDPFMLAGAVIGVSAQRLVRRLCPHCREAYTPAAEEIAAIRQRGEAGGYRLPDDVTLYRAVGCAQCGQLGYRGRRAVMEFLTITPEIKRALPRKAPREELRALTLAAGLRTLFAEGLRTAVAGETSLEEVLRVMPE